MDAAGSGAGNDHDARLVDLYDGDNPPGLDHEFFRGIADEIDARSILDLGCGTGLLTVTFCRAGRRVVGIDPSRTMLAFASTRTGSKAVTWILGDSRDIPRVSFDLAVMTGNVAQHITGGEWMRTLRDIRHSLRPGGVLAFESRNPNRREWERWTTFPATTRETVHGPLREWMEATEIEPGIVDLAFHNVFERTGEHLIERSLLAFRSCDDIRELLTTAGYTVDGIWADWKRTPVFPDAPIMVFEARASTAD